MFIVPCINDKTYLINVHRDATQSSLFIILQVHSTCFGYQPHPSSGVHKTVTTASSTRHIAKYKIDKYKIYKWLDLPI